MPSSLLEPVIPLIESKAAELGFEFFGARFFGAGGRSVLRVTIDRLGSGGVTADDCELMSVAVSGILDGLEFMGGKPYTLEVSSPGIDRPLKTERDFSRVAGRDVTLNLSAAVNGKKVLRGTALSCLDGILNIDTGKEHIAVPLSDILSGKEEIKFS